MPVNPPPKRVITLNVEWVVVLSVTKKRDVNVIAVMFGLDLPALWHQRQEGFLLICHQMELLRSLHPGKSVLLGQPQLLSFGVPFPRDTLFDASNLRVIDEEEIPVRTQSLALWRSIVARSN